MFAVLDPDLFNRQNYSYTKTSSSCERDRGADVEKPRDVAFVTVDIATRYWRGFYLQSSMDATPILANNAY